MIAPNDIQYIASITNQEGSPDIRNNQ